jgi:hypothetical protein
MPCASTFRRAVIALQALRSAAPQIAVLYVLQDGRSGMSAVGYKPKEHSPGPRNNSLTHDSRSYVTAVNPNLFGALYINSL